MSSTIKQKTQETRTITLLLEGYCNKILKACQNDSSVPFIPKWSRITMNFFLTFPCSYKFNYLFHNISALFFIFPSLDIPLQLVKSYYSVIHNSKKIPPHIPMQFHQGCSSSLIWFLNFTNDRNVYGIYWKQNQYIDTHWLILSGKLLKLLEVKTKTLFKNEH